MSRPGAGNPGVWAVVVAAAVTASMAMGIRQTFGLFLLPLGAEEGIPAVALAKAVGRAGATFPAVYNAANEQAVDAFHDGRLSFLGITDTIARVVDAHEPPPALTVESLAEAELWARRKADAIIAAS